MNQQRIFAVLTFLFLGGALSIIVIEKVYDGDWDAVLRNGGVPTNIADSASLQDSKAADHSAASKVVLVSADEVRDKIAGIPKLERIPWTTSEAESAFKGAASRVCALLPPNVYVTPIEPDAGSTANLKRLRHTAFTIGLQVDPSRRGELPTLSKNMIENYLADHVLAIQPTLIQAGKELFFDGTIHAAFYPVKSPSITVASEALINDAVSAFRVLGFYEDEKVEGTTGKTLVLAFKYVRELSAGGVMLAPQPEYEILLLNLPTTTSGPPAMIAFSTSEGRTFFEELDLSNKSSVTVLSNIRFQKFSGLYPASPIVLSVRNRSLSKTSLTDLLRKLAGGADTPRIRLTDFLREVHENPLAMPAPVPEGPAEPLPLVPPLQKLEESKPFPAMSPFNSSNESAAGR